MKDMSLDPSTFHPMSVHSMQEVWNRAPIDSQREAMPRMLTMWCVPNAPKALSLVQGTRSGESAVAQTVGIVDCGVTLVIDRGNSCSRSGSTVEVQII